MTVQERSRPARLGQLLVHVEIPADHPFNGETSFEGLPAAGPVDQRHLFDRLRHLAEVFGNEARDAVVDDFRNGASTLVFHETVHNREVLDALTRLARGQTFGYDIDAWKRWHAAELARGGDVKLK